jgi:DNA repair protein RecO (recombination protein O)
MGTLRTKGIVIKIANSSENDKILTVLTAERGKIKVFCKGAKKAKSALLASTEFLSYSDMILFEGNSDMYSLNSAESINVFYNIRTDIDKLMYAATIAQIMNDVCQEEELSFNRMQLLLNTLYVISETDKDLKLVYSIFRIRLLGILGFVPRLDKCVSCEKSYKEINELYFSLKDNGIKCETCKKLDKGALNISAVTYTSLVYILSSDPKKIFSFDIPEEAITELNLLVDLYMTEKVEKEYKVGL